MSFQNREIGSVFDVGLSTRDGVDLDCLNRDGKVVKVNQVAYVFGTKNQQQEATDLNRKSELTQYSSANVIDRDFTNWPQATQGNWSGGEGQRVYNDPTAYYQGRGLLWPPNAVVPGTPLVSSVLSDSGAANSGTAVPNIASGWVNGVWSWVYMFRPGGTLTLVTQGVDGVRHTDTTPNGLGGAASIHEFTIIGDAIFYANPDLSGGALVYSLYYSRGTGGGLVGNGPSAGTRKNTPNLMASGIVGSKLYVAVASLVDNTPVVSIHEVAKDTAATPAYTQVGRVDQVFPDGSAFAGFYTITSMCFSGDNLYVAAYSGQGVVIIQYNIAAGTYTTMAVLRSYDQAFMCDVGGELFILATQTATALSGFPGNSANDMYVLSGNQLTYGGSIPPFIYGFGDDLAYATPHINTGPINFGTYALFGIQYADPGKPDIGQSQTLPVVVYAYDTLKSKLFTVTKEMGTSTQIPVNWLTALAATTNPPSTTATNPTAQWGLVSWYAPGKYQIAYFGLSQASTTSPVAHPGRMVSSLIDFTSATVKLFRQLVIDHEPIPAGDTNAFVEVSVFLDQNPDTLVDAVADLNVRNTVAGSTRTVVPINQVARKLVYMVDYQSSVLVAGVAKPAPRPISIKIQASTGWTWQCYLALAENTKTNAQNSNAKVFESQGDGIDAVVAYNFLRQLWRLRGGECVVRWSNGDEYNAVLEGLMFASPKPFSQSFQADRQDGYESLVQLSIREDV